MRYHTRFNFLIQRALVTNLENMLQTITLPPLETIQENPKLRKKWIGYSTVDAYDTWLLHYSLSKKLKAEKCNCKTPELNKYEVIISLSVLLGAWITMTPTKFECSWIRTCWTSTNPSGHHLESSLLIWRELACKLTRIT